MIDKFKKEHSDKSEYNVYYLSSKSKADVFEKQYIKLRLAEGRVYDDETVSKLPAIKMSHRNYKEWKIREGSAKKLLKYLESLNKKLNILELGCGNGWLSNMVAGIPGSAVMGIDINEQELKQAAGVFGKKDNLVFVYADIFKADLNELKFDIIILAGVLMYFDDINKLILKLKELLNSPGEIHLIDNALYTKAAIDTARKNTIKHYEEIGLPEMESIIHHHLMKSLDSFNPVIIYNPTAAINKVKRKISRNHNSPFAWLKIEK